MFSLTVVIKKFAKQLEDWIGAALSDLPESLRLMKLNSKLLIHVPVHNCMYVLSHSSVCYVRASCQTLYIIS